MKMYNIINLIDYLKSNQYENNITDYELRQYLLELYNGDIPQMSSTLLEFIRQSLDKQNSLSESKYSKQTSNNIYNFSLAKTNVFLKNLNSLKKSSTDIKDSLDLMKNYSNLLLSDQQTTEELHVDKTSTQVQTVIEKPEQLLEYRSERDSRVRPEHKALDGTILPASDPFWREHAFTALGQWGCRCEIIPTKNPLKLPPGNISLKPSMDTASDIDLQTGKVKFFKESLPHFQNADPVIRKYYKK